LYEKGVYHGDEPLYPEAWRTFGQRREFRGAFLHVLPISAAALLVAFAAVVRV
jgi:hypothetical protein